MASRNPFRLRVSEYIEDEHEFLSLFGLHALDIFDVDDMWAKIQIIRSARGGGKSSILRIFNPKSLNEIYNSRQVDRIKPLYDRLRKLDVIDDEGGPKVLGIYLSLFGNYPVLEQLGFGDQKQLKYFYAHISSRIILATLRSVAELKKLEFPDELDQLYFKNPAEPNIPTSVPLPCTGSDLYKWAVGIETKVSNIIDDDEQDENGLGGFETLSILHVIKSKNIIFKGVPVAARSLLMLDDVDKLTSKQRISLSSTLVNLRVPLSIWLSERLEALKLDELIPPDGTPGREYDKPIMLEKFWRLPGNKIKFARLLSDIADKRAHMNKQYNPFSFVDYLNKPLSKNYDKSFNIAINNESNRLTKKFGERQNYKDWFAKCRNSDQPVDKKAEQWRALEIFIERDMHKAQQSLFPNETLSDDSFDPSSKETAVAEFYIRHKYKIPYYFGFEKLTQLASSNIQQFLNLSSKLFDEIISLRPFGQNQISEHRQEQILRKSVEDYWGEIQVTVPSHKHVISFLNSIGELCYEETNSAAASYGPVTGIALSDKDVTTLQNENKKEGNSEYKMLSDVISTCLAYNLLEQLSDSRQGGTEHLILYLNRQLCLHYNLPLNYGGWREQDLKTLCTYYKKNIPMKHKQLQDLNPQKILGDSR